MSRSSSNIRTVPLTAILDLILRRPVLFLAPIVIAVATALAYAGHVKLFRSEGIVLFQMDGITTDDLGMTPRFEEKKHTLVGSLVYGEPVRKIIRASWPDRVSGRRCDCVQ